MTWQSVEIIVEAALEESLSELLFEHGALSVTTAAADDTEVFEVNGQIDDSWQSIKLTGLFDQSMNLKSVIAQLSANPKICIDVSTLAEQNWEQAWLDYFVPIKINERLWVIPSWHERVDPDAINLLIDPGMSFGTGTHESTQLCLRWLSDMIVDGKTLLDYGCGSGILAIAGLKFGAHSAMATDIEPRSLSATLENAEKNNVKNKLEVFLPDLLPNKKVDIVIANILATTIIELKEVLISHVDHHGQLLLAGILSDQEQMIKQAIPQFQWQTRHQGNWIALLGQI